MFPIPSNSLNAPNAANFPQVKPSAEIAAVAPVDASSISQVGSATDAPAQASVTVDLSPVANFLLTVSQSREQITQLQTAPANGDDAAEAAARASTFNDATQNVVNAFNLLPSVELDQAQLRGPSLLNTLVESLNRQTGAEDVARQQSAAQSLAGSLERIGVTLRAPLSDTGGALSLDNQILRASFDTDRQSTTSTLQDTLDTFSELATRFAERLSTASGDALPAQNAETRDAASAAYSAAGNLAAINAAEAAQQARAAQVAAVQAATAQANPLQGNPALASAIAAYHLSDAALLSANARAVQASVGAVPRVAPVSGPARIRAIDGTS
jgi:hypothetical protein